MDVQSVYKTKTYVGEHNKRGSTCLPFQIMLKTLYIYEWSDTEKYQSQILTPSEVLLGLLLGLEECEFELWRALWLCEFSCGE